MDFSFFQYPTQLLLFFFYMTERRYYIIFNIAFNIARYIAQKKSHFFGGENNVFGGKTVLFKLIFYRIATYKFVF